MFILIFKAHSLVILKGRAQYMLNFINDYFRKVWVYFLKTRVCVHHLQKIKSLD
jgi:hypothetical protein